MKIFRKLLSLMTVCSLCVSFVAIPEAAAAGEVTITPTVEVKIGTASYVAYDNQTLSEGDKVRVRYQYEGPETEEIWSEEWYDEDNDIQHESELIGGKSIQVINFKVDHLDSEYFTVGTPVYYGTGYLAATKDDITTAGNSTDGLIFGYGLTAAYVADGIYSSSGRIVQAVYTLTKDLDKDIVIGASEGYNYIFRLAEAGIDGVETGYTDYTTNNGGVAFSSITLKGASQTIPVTSITLDKESITFDLNGGTTPVQLNATVLPDEATDKTVTWSSDNAKITVVDGLVSLNGAVAGDTATITAKAGEQTDTCTVTVVDTTPIAVNSISIDQDSITLDVYNNRSAQLTATVLPVDAADPTVTWSSNSDKITVNSSTGLVTLAEDAAAGDTATITATAGDKSDTCTVTVTDSTPIIPDEFDGVITHDDYAGVPEGKMIVTHSTYVTGVDADTRVSVSYNGGEARVFGTTLGDYLSINEGITIDAKVRFAVLCDDDLDADAFAFSIQ